VARNIKMFWQLSSVWWQEGNLASTVVGVLTPEAAQTLRWQWHRVV